MSIKQNFPTIDSSLNLDFVNSRVVDSRITFTRESAATHTDSLGVLQTIRNNKPRIDFDASTGECRGLLIEEQRTNLNNDAFLDYDGYYLTTTPRSAIAPDGTMTAHKIAASSVNRAGHRYEVYHAVSAATVYTHSVYVKAAGINYFHFFTFQDNNAYTSQSAGFNLSTGVTTTVTAGCTATITTIGNGWYRVTATVTSVSATSGGYIAWGLGDISASAFDGNDVDGAYVWGYQREVGSFATSYIPIAKTFVSRATSATYYDATGILRTAPANGARYGYGYDLTTGKWVSQGLIIEPSAVTNLIAASYGSSLSTVYALYSNWNSASISYNVAIGPDGAYSAYRSTPQSPTATSNFRFAATAGTRYTFSVWLKKDPGSNNTNLNYFGFQVAWSTNGSSLTGYSAIALQSVDGGSLDDTWRRFYFSYVCPAGATSMEMGVGNRGNGSGNPGYSVLCYGFQIEAGSAATSYIPTTGSTATRAGDVSTSAAITRAQDKPSINSANLLPLLDAYEGTIYSQGKFFGADPNYNNPTVYMNDGTASNYIALFNHASTYGWAQSSVGTQAGIVGISSSTNIDYKLAFGYKANDFAFCSNGGSVGTDTSGSVPNINQMTIGYRLENQSFSYNGHIKKIVYYPYRLSNTQLQALTV